MSLPSNRAALRHSVQLKILPKPVRLGKQPSVLVFRFSFDQNMLCGSAKPTLQPLHSKPSIAVAIEFSAVCSFPPSVLTSVSYRKTVGMGFFSRWMRGFSENGDVKSQHSGNLWGCVGTKTTPVIWLFCVVLAHSSSFQPTMFSWDWITTAGGRSRQKISMSPLTVFFPCGLCLLGAENRVALFSPLKSHSFWQPSVSLPRAELTFVEVKHQRRGFTTQSAHASSRIRKTIKESKLKLDSIEARPLLCIQSCLNDQENKRLRARRGLVLNGYFGCCVSRCCTGPDTLSEECGHELYNWSRDVRRNKLQKKNGSRYNQKRKWTNVSVEAGQRWKLSWRAEWIRRNDTWCSCCVHVLSAEKRQWTPEVSRGREPQWPPFFCLLSHMVKNDPPLKPRGECFHLTPSACSGLNKCYSAWPAKGSDVSE